MKRKGKKRARKEPGKQRSSLRSIGGVVVLAALLAAALPWWLGTRIEPAFESSIAAAAANAGLDVRNVSYHRGWLSSTAAETLAIRGAPLTIEAQYRIEHGPVALNRDDWRSGLVIALVHATYRLRGAGGAPAGLAKQLASLPAARMDVHIGLNSSAVGTFVLPAGKLANPKATITWTAMTADLHFVPDWSRVTTTARIPSIAITGPDAAVQVRGVQFNSDLHRGPAETMLGDSRLEVNSISLPGMIALTRLHAATHSHMANKLLNVDMDWGLRDSTVTGSTYGPAVMKTSVRRLDPLALMHFSHDVDALYKRSLPPEQMQMILFGKALVLAGNLSKRNPEFEVSELRLKTQYGALSGRAKFSVQGASQNITANPMLLVTAISGDADLVVPKTVFRAVIKSRIRHDVESLRRSGNLSREEAERLTPETLDKIADAAYPTYLQSSGLLRFFRADGDDYRFHLTVQRGLVTINGRPVNPMAMTGKH